jgi:hypothetical protein
LNVCNVGTKGNHKAENSYKTDIPDTSWCRTRDKEKLWQNKMLLQHFRSAHVM